MRRHAPLMLGIALVAGCAHDRPMSPDPWMRAHRSATYRTPDNRDASRLAQAFAESFGSAEPRAWDALGYETRVAGGERQVREQRPAHQGWGAYAFADGGRPLVVQAPHSESDRHTGDIAYAIYRETGAHSFAMNSAHRSLPGADPSTHSSSPFVSMAREAARRDASTVVLQVHGFGQGTAHRYELGPEAIVASNGTREPDAALRGAVRCLLDAGFDVRLFPEEAPYPGGTRNAVARALTRDGRGRFLHLELGPALRERLARDASRVGELARCL